MTITSAENLVAISADFHTHTLYSKFYDKKGDTLGGFTGIYGLVIKMGDALTRWERTQKDPWKKFDWVEVCESYVHLMITEAIADDDPYFMPDVAATLTQVINRLHP